MYMVGMCTFVILTLHGHPIFQLLVGLGNALVRGGRGVDCPKFHISQGISQDIHKPPPPPWTLSAWRHPPSENWKTPPLLDIHKHSPLDIVRVTSSALRKIEKHPPPTIAAAQKKDRRCPKNWVAQKLGGGAAAPPAPPPHTPMGSYRCGCSGRYWLPQTFLCTATWYRVCTTL